MSSAFVAQKVAVPGGAAIAVLALALGLGLQFGVALIAGVAVFVTVFLLVQDTKTAVKSEFDMLAEEDRAAAERAAKKHAREAALKEKEAKRRQEVEAAEAAKAEKEAAKKAAKKAEKEAAILKALTPVMPVRAPEPAIDTSKMSKAQLKKYKKDQAQREEEEHRRMEEERKRLEELAKKLAAEEEAKKAAKKAKKLGPVAEAALAKKKKEEEAAKFAALLKSGAAQDDLEEGWTSVVAPSSSKKSSSVSNGASAAESAAAPSSSSKKGGKGAAAAAAAEGGVYVPETVIQLPIEEKQRSLLMGTKGKTLMLLEEGTGAQIEVPKKDNKLGQVRLIGTAETVQKAKVAIESLLNFGYSSITDPGVVHEDLIVEPKHYGTIIGSQGAYLNAIQSKTETRIRVPNAGSKASEPVRVVGLKDNVLLACLAIKELIADGYSPLTHEGYERREVAFPREKLPFLIGPKGQTIRSIEKNTKTRINVSEVSHPGYVVVIGPPAGIDAAQRELARLLIPPEVVQLAPEAEYVNGTWASTNFTEDELW